MNKIEVFIIGIIVVGMLLLCHGNMANKDVESVPIDIDMSGAVIIYDSSITFVLVSEDNDVKNLPKQKDSFDIIGALKGKIGSDKSDYKGKFSNPVFVTPDPRHAGVLDDIIKVKQR